VEGKGHVVMEDVPSMNVEVFAEKYLKYVETNFAKKTLDNAARVMNSFSAMFGSRDISTLTLVDLETFKEKRKLENVSDATINMDIRTLKASMQLALDWKLIQEHPFEKAKPIRTTQKVKSHFTDDEILKLLNVIKDEWFARIVKIAILTGLRRGEILNLRWDDYDAENGTVNIQSSPGYRVKGGKMRKIPLQAEGIALLSEIPQGNKDDKIFTREDGSDPAEDAVTKKFKRAVKAAGLSDDLHFHSLRHTFGTKAANSGVSANVLKAIMGHSNIKTTEGYMGRDEDAMRAQIQKVALPVQPKQQVHGSNGDEVGGKEKSDEGVAEESGE
jgi:integrase